MDSIIVRRRTARPARGDGRVEWLAMTPSSRHRLALALIFITPAMWSTNYLVARAAAGIVPPHALAFWRWFFAFLLMLPFAWSNLRAQWPHWKREWPDFILLGLFGMWICGAFVYIGGETTSALNIGLIYAAAPVVISLIAHWLFKEHLSPVQYCGIALCLFGVLFVILKGQLQQLAAVVLTVGDGWIVAAASSWVLYSLLLRKRKSVLDPFARLTCIAAGGLVVLLPFVLIETYMLGAPKLTTQTATLIGLVAVLPGFGAYQAYSFMQKELGTARASLVLYLGPPYAAAIAWVILDEIPKWYHYAGALLVLGGMFLASRKTLFPIRKPI
jgi:drug/metabolite transporter (DMT)-like permease